MGVMERIEKVFEFVDRDGRGLEIGPSHSPLAPKSAGFDCVTVDHASKEVLTTKYRGLGIAEDMLDRIEEVDYIWAGERLTDLIDEKFDYIIASHLLEHTVDMIAFFEDCEKLLKPGGGLTLILPDKRFCFDHFRPHTSTGRVVDAHISQDTRFHTIGTAIDSVGYMCTMESVGVSWWPGADAPLHLEAATVSRSDASVEAAYRQDEYVDLHNWVFTPASFRLLVRDLNELGFTRLRQVGGYPTSGCEFFATLKVGEDHSEQPTREALMFAMEREVHEGSFATDNSVGAVALKELRVENRKLRAQLSKSKKATKAIKKSTSWQITRPVRKLSRTAKQIARKSP